MPTCTTTPVVNMVPTAYIGNISLGQVKRLSTRLQVLFPAVSLFAALMLVPALHAQSPVAGQAPTEAEVSRFVDSLLSRMTLAEKINQMEQAAGQPMYTPVPKADELARNGIGSFLFTTDPVRINELQRIAVTQSRLHIPLLFGYDVIHGFRTIAPIPLAMASSWDPGLVERTQGMAAKEARLAGVQWAFAPMSTLRVMPAGAASWRAQAKILTSASRWRRRRCADFKATMWARLTISSRR